MHSTPGIDIPLAAISGSRVRTGQVDEGPEAAIPTAAAGGLRLGPDNAVYPLNQYRNPVVLRAERVRGRRANGAQRDRSGLSPAGLPLLDRERRRRHLDDEGPIRLAARGRSTCPRTSGTTTPQRWSSIPTTGATTLCTPAPASRTRAAAAASPASACTSRRTAVSTGRARSGPTTSAAAASAQSRSSPATRRRSSSARARRAPAASATRAATASTVARTSLVLRTSGSGAPPTAVTRSSW